MCYIYRRAEIGRSAGGFGHTRRMGPEEASDAGMLCMCVCVCATLCVELKKLADILSPRAETLQKSTIHAHGA